MHSIIGYLSRISAVFIDATSPPFTYGSLNHSGGPYGYKSRVATAAAWGAFKDTCTRANPYGNVH